MKTILILFSLAFLCSCGLPMAKVKQNPELMEYAKPILEEAAKRNVNLRLNTISFRFAEDNDNANGSCIFTYRLNYMLQPYTYGKEIRINPRRWAALNSDQRHKLIEHEIGHCALGRKHNAIMLNIQKDDNVYLNIPKSIMFPSGFDTDLSNLYNTKYSSYFYEELFNKKVNTKKFLTESGLPITYYSESLPYGLCADGTHCPSNVRASSMAMTEEENYNETESEDDDSSCEKHIMENETDSPHYTDDHNFLN